MKKFLFFASALAGLFLASSCQRENLEPVVNSGVTYEISLPDGPQTKGEAGYATYSLHYEVYKTAGNAEALADTPLLFDKTVEMTGNKTTVTLDLLNDQDYTVLFWANKKGTDYFDIADDRSDLRAVGVKQASSNNDDRDAFCGMDQIVNHDAAQSKTVTLTRPFAQLNIATLVSTNDYDIVPQSSLVKLTSIPTAYNVFTGEPVGAITEVTYTVNLVPDGNLTVNGTEYKKVAMNYLLVPESNISVYYEINTLNGTVKNTIENVPVKKNYRTNIIGNLLTSNATYTVEIKPGFEEEQYYGPEFVKEPAYDADTKTYTVVDRYELLWVADKVNSGEMTFEGATVQVAADIDLENKPWTPIGNSTTITFKGMFEGVALTKAANQYPTISNLKIENGNCSGLFGLLCNGGKVRNLNFRDVNISGERQLGVVVGQVYGNLEQPTIENVTVDNAVITAVPSFNGTEYDNGDKVGGIAGLIGQQAYIKDCTVKNSTFTGYRDMGGIVGCTQNGYSCNLTGNTTNNIKFFVTSYYNPYNKNTPHGATGAIRGGTRANENDVIVDNTSSEISEVIIVKDQVSLQNAINAAGVGETYIQFASDSDINGNVTVVQKPGVKISIDGAGNEYDGVIKVHGNSNYYEDAALTIKNVAFKSTTTYINSDGDPYFNFIEALENGSERYSSNITVEECSFTHETANIAVGLQIKATRNAKVLGCTATKMHSLIQAQSCGENVEVKSCTIKEGKNGVAFKQVKTALVEGTTIEAAEYGIRFDGNTDNYGITLKDNTVEARQPFIVRKMTGKNNTIALEGTNTLTPATSGDYQIVITNGSDDAEYVMPTGTYTLTGAGSFNVYPKLPVAKVGSTEYFSIDDAIANWTHNTTLTLVADVTLSDVITLKSTEYHVLDLGTYTMTAATKKDAIQISNEGRSSASWTLDIKADATNPGGITAAGKAVVRTAGKSGVKDRPIIRFYNGVFNASYIIYHTGSNGTNCPQFQFHNGVYDGTIYANRSLIQFYGGTFNGSLMMSVDSSAYALIAGGRFKQLSNLYMSSLNSSKFTIGSAKGVFDKGVYVDDEGYYVVGGDVITEFGDKFKAKVTNVSDLTGSNNYLYYSSAATYGLYYTNKDVAITKHGEANVVLP